MCCLARTHSCVGRRREEVAVCLSHSKALAGGLEKCVAVTHLATNASLENVQMSLIAASVRCYENA